MDLVRSSKAEEEELLYILSNSESTALVVENRKTLNKLRDRLNDLPIQFAIWLSDEEPETDRGLKTLNFQQAIDASSDRFRSRSLSRPVDRRTL